MAPPAISEERATELLAPYLPIYGHCWLTAESDWLAFIPAEIRATMSTTWKARFYWERANIHARASFAAIDAARSFVLGRTIPCIEIEDAVWTRFKKLVGPDLSTVGYPTVQRLTLTSQGHLDVAAEEIPFPWGVQRPLLVSGYTLDAFGRINALYMAYPNGRRNAYEIPISLADAFDLGRKLPSATPATPDATSAVPIVRRRAE